MLVLFLGTVAKSFRGVSVRGPRLRSTCSPPVSDILEKNFGRNCFGLYKDKSARWLAFWPALGTRPPRLCDRQSEVMARTLPGKAA
jgi:hypothetical protein